MTPTIGRTVIYTITEEQAATINRRRTTGSEIAARIHTSEWPTGAQAHIGNGAWGGEEYPMVIVRVWPDEFGIGKPGINGQVLLDGNDTLWVTSAGEGDAPGKWHWPTRV
jgi:hypothetical protein